MTRNLPAPRREGNCSGGVRARMQDGNGHFPSRIPVELQRRRPVFPSEEESNLRSLTSLDTVSSQHSQLPHAHVAQRSMNGVAKEGRILGSAKAEYRVENMVQAPEAVLGANLSILMVSPSFSASSQPEFEDIDMEFHSLSPRMQKLLLTNELPEDSEIASFLSLKPGNYRNVAWAVISSPDDGKPHVRAGRHDNHRFCPQAPWSLSRISRAWRSAALFTAEIWSYIAITIFSPVTYNTFQNSVVSKQHKSINRAGELELLRLQLARSGSAPLCISLFGRVPNVGKTGSWKIIIDELVSRSSRWESLCVTMEQDDRGMLLNQIKDRLRRLHWHIGGSTPNFDDIPRLNTLIISPPNDWDQEFPFMAHLTELML
ncbi:hypothetical protein C8J56DRAFT_1026722 [Mycena floridula]|nr:hypothetical protein C8J56DRAFT_1026722 [Mycena floridula]